MRLVLICFLLFFVPLHSVWAQKTKYSDAIISGQMYIAGTIGNTFHAWSVSKKPGKIYKHLTLLTLHIFSPGLDLIDEKKISLGESIITNIDFQMEHSFYYINIIYTAGTIYNSGSIYISSPTDNKRLIYKIDAAGNLTDVTDTPGLFNKLPYSLISPSGNFNSSNVFTTKLSYSVADSTIIDEGLLPGENFDGNQSYEKLKLQKISIGKKRVVAEKMYASGYLHFSDVMVTATDSTVYAGALAQSKTVIGKNPYQGPYLFLTRLNTNLVEPANGMILLKNEKWPGNLVLTPNAIFSLNNRLLVFSTGLYSKTTFVNNLDLGRNAVTTYIPMSIMITRTDENNHLLTDTSIKIKEGREQLQWGNRFIVAAGNEVYLFCSHLYRASKAGITLFTIGADGEINERELIVNENYSYGLKAAISLGPGVLLVPYAHKGKTGLMRLTYGTTE